MWGKLVESLVEGDLTRLLNEIGIPVNSTLQRKKGCVKGENYEFDIIAEDGTEIVIVEVKTTLKSADIKNFIAKLKKVRDWMPEYKNNRIYGAVAWIQADSQVISQAENEGLLVIRATGKNASIINHEGFSPKDFVTHIFQKLIDFRGSDELEDDVCIICLDT